MSVVSRRGFLQGAAAATGGLAVGCASKPPPEPAGGGARVSGFDAWIHVTNDDRFLLFCDKVEMGQGTFTLFASLVAEELDVDIERIEVQHAPVDPAYADGMPVQGTGGSSSTSDRYLPLRESGARARAMLLAAGAERLGTDASSLRTENGAVIHDASGRRATYGELADAAAHTRAPREVTLKSPDQFRYIGKEIPRIDGAAKATGTASFGIDTDVPGLRSAVVVRPPLPGGSVTRYDEAAARAVPGVEQVVPVSTGVAVVATNTWRARRGAEALAATFELPEGKRYDSEALRSEHYRILREEDGDTVLDEGDVEAAIARSPQKLDVVYHTTHQAHATMEPMNCTVVPGAEGIDVYVGTQTPGIVQDVVSSVFGRSRSDVTVHTTFLGGGFGRRFFPDVAAEAAEIAKATGTPIKLVYSREDDTHNDFYRPATAHRMRGGVSADGRASAWSHHIVAPSMIQYMIRGITGAIGPEWLRGTLNSLGNASAGLVGRMAGPVLSLEGATDIAYDVTNQRVSSTLFDPGIHVGIWRSVGHSNNGFVIESFVDELAHAAGSDPVTFRRTLLAKHPRHLAALDLVAEKSGWDKAPAGRGQGVAVYESFGTVVGEVAEVSVEGRSITVEKVTCAVHCGTAVNPDIVRAQIEGGVVYGLTAAMKGQVTFKDGVPVESNFHDYPMLRMNEMPAIEVHIVPSDDPPTGVGEPGTPPIAAAVGNAVFDATGVRLRELPLWMPA